LNDDEHFIDDENNVERIKVKEPENGEWIIRVTADRIAVGGAQNYSLVITSGSGVKDQNSRNGTC
jgi:uncharacterized membrane protein